MAYPFEQIEHCTYKKTFLKDVRVAVEFPKVEPSKVDMDALREFFTQFTNEVVNLDGIFANERATFCSKDNAIALKFGLDYSEVTLCTPTYSSFEASMPYWQWLIKYLGILGVNNVTRLVVRKYSALYFKSNTADYNIRSFMSEVFCKDLMQLIPTNIGSYKALNSLEKTWTAKDEDSKTVFTTVFGIKKTDFFDRHDKLTLVNSIESTDGTFPVDDLLNRMEKYNKILFDAFHWCVKEDIIEKMKN